MNIHLLDVSRESSVPLVELEFWQSRKCPNGYYRNRSDSMYPKWRWNRMMVLDHGVNSPHRVETTSVAFWGLDTFRRIQLRRDSFVFALCMDRQHLFAASENPPCRLQEPFFLSSLVISWYLKNSIVKNVKHEIRCWIIVQINDWLNRK